MTRVVLGGQTTFLPEITMVKGHTQSSVLVAELSKVPLLDDIGYILKKSSGNLIKKDGFIGGLMETTFRPLKPIYQR